MAQNVKTLTHPIFDGPDPLLQAITTAQLRAHNQCQFCHHIISSKPFPLSRVDFVNVSSPNYNPDNILILCPACSKKWKRQRPRLAKKLWPKLIPIPYGQQSLPLKR